MAQDTFPYFPGRQLELPVVLFVTLWGSCPHLALPAWWPWMPGICSPDTGSTKKFISWFIALIFKTQLSRLLPGHPWWSCLAATPVGMLGMELFF